MNQPPKLYPHQARLNAEIDAAYAAGARNVLASSATGSGKTVILAHRAHTLNAPSCLIAHRQELVGQISLAIAKEGMPHTIIASNKVVRNIIAWHNEELGGSLFNPAAITAVAGVDTLIKRKDLDRWRMQIQLWILDEAHHQLVENKWGKAAEMFPNARGLGVTATPGRADGKGLGRHADGLFDVLVQGPEMRELITAGYLSDYRIVVPPSNLKLDQVELGSSGDYKHAQLVNAVKRSTVVGDAVEHYRKFAPGKLGLTFCVSVDDASACAARYSAAGIPAAVISGNTPTHIRNELIKRFRSGKLRQICTVDVFNEGADFPAVECLSFLRPTKSFTIYCQQWGRGSRIYPGKTHTVIIDHVGNFHEHNGPPDKLRVWSLDRRPATRRNVHDPDLIPTVTCSNLECLRPYEAVLPCCPYCRVQFEPAERSGPEYVAGDLVELDPAVLAQIRGEIAKIDVSEEEFREKLERNGAPRQMIMGATAQHRRRKAAQRSLRRLLTHYAKLQAGKGRGDQEAYKRFYCRYNVDAASAQYLGRREAELLTLKLADDLSAGRY